MIRTSSMIQNHGREYHKGGRTMTNRTYQLRQNNGQNNITKEAEQWPTEHHNWDRTMARTTSQKRQNNDQ